MVILVVNTVNRIYSYIKIFCLQNHNALYIITEKGYPQPWLSAIHTPPCLPKQNEIFVWSIYCSWVDSLVVLGLMSQPLTEQSAAECY